jgi:drug/metabolite transporter (DMT)-like permease
VRSQQIGITFVVMAAIGWGLNWPAIKLVLRDWPPLFARGTAGLAAAMLLVTVASIRRESLKVSYTDLPRLMSAAATNVFAWMGFGTLAMVWLDVAEGALLVYTMPIWAMLFSWPIRGERPDVRGLAALALGTAGITVLLGGSEAMFRAEKLPGVLLALGAAVLFALGTVASRARLELSPLTSVAWQVGIGCAPMFVLGFLVEKPDFQALTQKGWAAMAYMTAVPMALCYVAWFAALDRLPASVASTGTLLVPLVGVVSAAMTLGEPLGAREVTALVLTLAGVTLALRRA